MMHTIGTRGTEDNIATFRRTVTMNFRFARRTSPFLLTFGASLFVVTTAAIVCGQGPADDPNGAPVRKELDEFREKALKKTPPDRLRAYEQGIDDVRKSGVTDKALKVGDRAPDFELTNAVGKKVKLSELTARGPVVLTWYRGGWCPYCNIALRGFHKSLPEIRSAGATLVALSPESPDNTLSTAEKNHLDFEVLSDRGNKVAHAYGVAYKIPKVIAEQFKGRLDLAKHNGDDSAELPLGATYVVDRGGVIRYAFIDADYRKRAEPSTVLAVLRGLDRKP
jgi:peroxiredoxin